MKEYGKNKEYHYIVYQNREQNNEKLPLILFLHGAGERGNDLDLVDNFSSVQKISGMLDQKNFIFVVPQCTENTFWVADIAKLKEFIDYLLQTYNIDENRISLTGISMGGFGVWYTAMAYPDLFYKIAPICGGGMSWNTSVLKMPVWAFHGEKDDVVPVFYSQDMIRALKMTNPYVRLTTFPECDHNCWDAAYNSTLIDWLIQ